ncbi:hypothetical protein GCM10023143_21860 [Compostibacter hankyongensis]|uniref:CinA C-terminal domain-containing protein n=2 Tax=Compostibacter hankyongensis TaxID=1007089 RepID=A0ABP8FW85_9BACT
MASRHLSLAFAESATAGRLAYEYSRVPDSGTILKGGLVCYDARVKEEVLGVPVDMIRQYSPESAEVTGALAERLQLFMKPDITVAVTGLITPGGSETASKPVGTIFIHILMGNVSKAVREVFSGSPEQRVLKTADRVAELILNML